jgi:hypothetical protein
MNGIYDPLISSRSIPLNGLLAFAKIRGDGEELAALTFSLQSLVENGMGYFFRLKDKMTSEIERTGICPFIRNPSNGDAIVLPRSLYSDLTMAEDDILNRFLWGMGFVMCFSPGSEVWKYDVNDYVLTAHNKRPKYFLVTAVLENFFEPDHQESEKETRCLYINQSAYNKIPENLEYSHITVNYDDDDYFELDIEDDTIVNSDVIGLVDFREPPLGRFCVSSLNERLLSHMVGIYYTNTCLPLIHYNNNYGNFYPQEDLDIKCVELVIPNIEEFIDSAETLGEEILEDLDEIYRNEDFSRMIYLVPSLPSKIQDACDLLISEFGKEIKESIDAQRFKKQLEIYRKWYTVDFKERLNDLLGIKKKNRTKMPGFNFNSFRTVTPPRPNLNSNPFRTVSPSRSKEETFRTVSPSRSKEERAQIPNLSFNPFRVATAPRSKEETFRTATPPRSKEETFRTATPPRPKFRTVSPSTSKEETFRTVSPSRSREETFRTVTPQDQRKREPKSQT